MFSANLFLHICIDTIVCVRNIMILTKRSFTFCDKKRDLTWAMIFAFGTKNKIVDEIMAIRKVGKTGMCLVKA